MERSGFERASRLLVASREWLGDRVPGGWSRRSGDQVGSVTGIPVPSMNGVWSSSPDGEAMAGLLAAVRESALPFCAQFPAGSPVGREVAGAVGLSRDEDVPLMYTRRRPAVAAVPGLTVRRLASAELAVHAEIAAAGFGAPAALFAPMTALGSAEKHALRFYVGEVEGVPVVTGLGLRLLDHVGVFNIATPPQHRRNRYGGAITARIVADAFADGARGAWLQSSSDGFRVYERTGFSAVGSWECWISG